MIFTPQSSAVISTVPLAEIAKPLVSKMTKDAVALMSMTDLKKN